MGLRVRGRGGWDRTSPVAAPKSAFLWGSTPFLFARAKKWGGTGRAGAVYCLIKRRTRNRVRQGGLVIVLSACALLLWAVVVGLSCDSTPFLWCLPKETVSSRQRKALFLPWWLHHSRERYCLGGLYSSSPDLGRGLVRVGAGVGAYLSFILHILPKTQKSAANLLPCGAEFVMIYLKRR